MTREEFEKKYADKYLDGDVQVVIDNRDGEAYTDHHIDLCWKVQNLKDISEEAEVMYDLMDLEW